VTALAWLIVAAALGLGLVAGAVLSRRVPGVGDRGPTPTTPLPEKSADGAAPRRRRAEPETPELGELLYRTFRQSGSGLAVVAANGDVLLHNSRAELLGVVTSGRVDPRAWAACQRVPAGESRLEVDLSPLDRTPRGPVAV
jgi:two-component system, OmpR family, sensor histidine kinase SenX3